MFAYIVNDQLASYLEETFYEVNHHSGLCLAHLLWDPTVKTTLLQGTVFSCQLVNEESLF